MSIRILPALMLIVLGFPAAAGATDAGPLIKPAGLMPDVDFWKQIFSSTTTEQGLVHDNRRLDIVYEVVSIPAGASSGKRRRIGDSARRKYREILNQLGNGQRQGLSGDAMRVLSLWGADTSNDEFRQAARRVRFQQGLADRFRGGLERSGRWRTHIVTNLTSQGVPVDLAALPHVESSFNPKAQSHVGAVGLWQFTRPTGRRFMQVDHVVDERRDPYRSSEAAASLLSYNYSILGEWPLAITAYNHGVAGMRRAVRKTGTSDIEKIVREYSGRTFGFASRNFYVAFLAAREVEAEAEQHFGTVVPQPPRDELVVSVPSYMRADTLARAFRLSNSTLREYNPALLPPVWNGTKYVPSGFELRLPADTELASPESVLASVDSSEKFDRQTPDLYHKIIRGDTLSTIAARYRTNVRELMALNGLHNSRIVAGRTLRLPWTGDGLPPIDDRTERYVVRKGDTFGSIAKRAGMTQSELLALNRVADRNRIYPGQELRLRRTEAVAAAPSPAPVAVAATVPVPPPERVATAAAEQAGSGLPVSDNDRETDDQERIVSRADPNDYVVADNGTIEVQSAETLGHYADWLGIRTQRLRDLNGYSFRQPLVVGNRLKLDLSRVSAKEFNEKRLDFHRSMQEAFFTRYRIADMNEHRLRRGENVWYLAQRKFRVPVWLLRQYNPELDFDRLQPGARIVYPVVETVGQAQARRNSLAEAG